jgi:hypothetical protein
VGLETICAARLGNKKSEGRAMLETDYVLFRGDFRVKIPFREMKSIQANDGWLEIGTSEGALALQIGAAAERWAHKILHPPSRLDKLGVKPGTRVSVVALKDPDFAQELAARGAEIHARLAADSDLIFFAAPAKPALTRLETLARSIKVEGGIWVVYPKGVHQITENDVLSAIRAAGLVDVKVASFSATHTALKAVIPKSRGPGRG